ncbi:MULTISPECIES: hypothetical protein [Vibrio]|uniref:hypothetical protein n=1 Tax=Vibrio TaxID=662 RepID=UPI0008413673|nr:MULTISPECIES: hypothetical protein [Vibrio]ODM56041.1 hypothetical protein BC455_22860 [Vibrio harveyi]USD58578.1 hypothetical protein J4N44_26870 [Vibrio sp. SCSIO 43155]
MSKLFARISAFSNSNDWTLLLQPVEELDVLSADLVSTNGLPKYYSDLIHNGQGTKVKFSEDMESFQVDLELRNVSIYHHYGDCIGNHVKDKIVKSFKHSEKIENFIVQLPRGLERLDLLLEIFKEFNVVGVTLNVGDFEKKVIAFKAGRSKKAQESREKFISELKLLSSF